MEYTTLEALHLAGFDCYGFVSLDALTKWERHLPEGTETATVVFEHCDGHKVYFLGVKNLRGKAAAHAAMEGES